MTSTSKLALQEESALTTASLRQESRAQVAATPRRSVPVVIWAGVGALILAFQIFVWVTWISGPYFKRVHTGATHVPSWMKVVQSSWTGLGFVGMAFVVYWFVWRPWRRDGRLSTDSLLVIAFATTVYFWDPTPNYSGQWFTYNSYLFNMGSWTQDIPGWLAPGHPGHMMVEPILWIEPTYIYLMFPWMLAGCWLMGKVRARWPRLSNFELIVAVWAIMAVSDFVLEGFIYQPLGFYSYGGANRSVSLNPGHYYQFPFYESVLLAAMLTAWAAIRYFKNDKGETIVERGVSGLRASQKQKTCLRFLALSGAFSLVYVVTYVLPCQYVASHPAQWPTDVQKRSYFTEGICGAGTNTGCPGPSVPNPRGNHSARVGPNGALSVPPGTRLARFVPTDRDTPGGAYGK
jgi:Spirocyclase AveC-like